MNRTDKIIAILMALSLTILALILIPGKEILIGGEASASPYDHRDSPYLVVIKSPPIRVWVLATVTAYSSTVDQTDSTPHITASQTHVREGIVACPRKLPFGTEITIQGRFYVCEDRMALKNDGKFDIWMPSRSQALAFGRQIIKIEIK